MFRLRALALLSLLAGAVLMASHPGRVLPVESQSTNSPSNTTGRTAKPGSPNHGCITCHGAQNTTINATLTGQASLYPGDYGVYKMNATQTGITAATSFGFDVSASDASAVLSLVSGEPTATYDVGGLAANREVTHAGPPLRQINTATNYYSFRYTMPAGAAAGDSHILYGLVGGNSVAGWNDASPLTITTKAMPTSPSTFTAGTPTSSTIPLSWSGGGPQYRVLMKTGTYPSSSTDSTATVVYEGPTPSTTASGLSPTTTYFFALYGEDYGADSGALFVSSSGRQATATTAAAPLVAADALTVTNLSSSGMTLTWRSGSPESRAIYKAASVPTSPADGTLIYEGINTTAPVTGLAGGTRYFIAVYGKASGVSTYSSTANTTSVITLDGSLIDAAGGSGGPRQPNTSQGQVLYGNDPVTLFNGTSTIGVQPKTTEDVDQVVFALGNGSSAGHVIGAWRRGTDHLWISTDGGTPVLVPSALSNPFDTTKPTNPEGVAVADGCVFATLQAFSNAQAVKHVFKIDPVTGNATNLTGTAVVPGLNSRIRTSQCKAVWGFDDGTTNLQMQYYPGTGTAIQTIDTVAKSNTFFGIGAPWISQGRIVYGKIVGTVPQIFLYDTNLPSPAPVQITNYTDATMGVSSVQTDGRHVVWFRSKADGTLPEIDFNGGVTLATSPTAVGQDLQLQMNRGQLLWKDVNSTLRYESAQSSTNLNAAATSKNVWLSDGFAAFGDTVAAGAFRYTGVVPNDAQQPAAPLVVQATGGAASVALAWDAILGATSYNVYYASQPGLTKANYAALGGTRITGITSPSFTASGLTPNAPYYFIVTTVDGSGEGPASRQASAVVLGNPAWTSVGGLSATNMVAVTADRSVINGAYASNGSNNTYGSTDGGQTWSALGGGIAGQSVRSLAANGGTVFATTQGGSIYRSTNSGGAWTNVASGTSGQFNQAIAIDPAIPTTIVAGDFRVASFTGGLYDADLIRSDDNGATWFHLPQATSGSLTPAIFTLAFDPSHSSTLFAGGNGTPNIAKSIAGGAGWADVSPGAGSGYMYTVVVDPQNSQTVYAGTTQAFGAFSPGIWKSTNSGASWTKLTTGLPASLAVHSIVVDPADSNLIHVGSEVGYYYSTNGGASWTPLNTGLPNANAQYVSALAMTGSHRLVAATADGLYLLNLSVAPAPTVTSINPTSGNIAGGTAVTITGTNFVSGATVTFGGVAATGVTFVNSTTLTATTPAHTAATVNVVVQNPDAQTGTLTNGFTYNTALAQPTDFSALGVSSTSVGTNWTPVSGATGYVLYRRSAATAGSFVSVGTPAAPPYTDTTASPNQAYQYRVRATNASTQSTDSPADIATTVVFTDDPLVAGTTPVKAVHLAELRTAVDALRALVALAGGTYTDPATTGTPITATQINELRTALDGARTLLSLPVGNYTDTLTAGVTVKAAHFQEIRFRVK